MIRRQCFAAALASAAFFALPGFASADPTLVQGMSARQSAAYNMPEPAAEPSARQFVAAAPESNLGGGLLEFLFTGHNSGQVRPQGHAAYGQPQQAAISAHYDPEAQPRRTIDPIYLRQEVDYFGREKPGTIVIDTPNKFLFLVEPGGRALRYGIGVGRSGFTWSGTKIISRKAEWPDWTPPADMLMRRPDLPMHMEGGPANPLGARALYLGSSLYRIHGTNEPYTIGTNVSSGCIRMMNEDVIDLYGRVGVGTKVIVL
jgi:lipoprotein-anchoring transpeptidase ErfK/SrfK